MRPWRNVLKRCATTKRRHQ